MPGIPFPDKDEECCVLDDLQDDLSTEMQVKVLRKDVF